MGLKDSRQLNTTLTEYESLSKPLGFGWDVDSNLWETMKSEPLQRNQNNEIGTRTTDNDNLTSDDGSIGGIREKQMHITLRQGQLIGLMDTDGGDRRHRC
ncbi:hypothetical protein L2E82_06689 [Cichorium intybus]|uniref:Uncharacterized protein n=1 Tax=Cichorium intybus TaxID=13427 RepID=A0ACB9HBU0_CICIN|nr:hypothetical protein L2E82_06689 [Cichorium intybus]